MHTGLRSFFLLVLLTPIAHSAERQLIDVRFYHFRSEESAKKFDVMMRDAAIPVMKRQGIGPVGVFQVQDSPDLDDNDRVLIRPFNAINDLLELRAAYRDDPDFWPNARDFLLQEKGNPAYDRVESMLLVAFTGMPALSVPGSGDGKQRRFELRTYKSENAIQGLLKVEMFNKGEIAIFDKCGLQAVFYGEALVAPNLPQLTYLLVHEDEAAQAKAWKTFIEHPEWKSLSREERYQTIKLKITKHMLTATDYSPIK